VVIQSPLQCCKVCAAGRISTNSHFWDDALSVIVADVVKELACCLHVQSLTGKENLAYTDPEDGGSKLLQNTAELSYIFLEKFEESGLLSRTSY
jgi:hypothetical protein